MNTSVYPSAEPLEARIAPASFSFVDVDGDKVVISVSHGPDLVEGGNVILSGHQLQLLDLSASGFKGADVSIIATRNPDAGGDGFVNVGRINGGTNDLGKVKVDGDLAVIDCGDGAVGAPALKSLTAQSMGRLGTSTGAPDLTSNLLGTVNKIVINGDIVGASWLIAATEDSDRIGSITVKGSIIGGGTADSGTITASGDIGPVLIRGDIRAGGGANTGVITAGSKMGAVLIGGDLRADDETGANSAMIVAEGEIGNITIGGSIVGMNTNSAKIDGFTLGKVTIGGDVVGGSGIGSAVVHGSNGMGAVKVGGDIRGAGTNSARIVVDSGLLAGVTIGGDLTGGGGSNSGQIHSGRIGSVKITGDVRANFAPGSGWITAVDSIGTVKVGGNFVGQTGNPASIIAAHSATATATADLVIKSVTIGGNVEWGRILAGFDPSAAPTNPHAQIGSVLVKGAWVAGSISAGIDPKDGFFGNADDSVITPDGFPGPDSSIASIIIQGAVQGTVGGTDHFGFVAQRIGKFSVGRTAFPLTPGAGTDDLTASDPKFLVGATNDVRVHEVPVIVIM